MIGIILLAIVIIALIAPLDTIFARNATFISEELNRASGNETPVNTKMDFGDADHVATFPKKFGSWIGLNYNASKEMEGLGADFVILRTYLNQDYYQPVKFVVVQSSDQSSFHPPPICYAATGWKIEEEGTAELPVTNADWASNVQVGTGGHLKQPIKAKKMVVVKQHDGVIQEREVVLYYYVKGWMFDNKITMVEVSVEAPVDGSYEQKLSEAAGFMAETIPLMFEPAESEEILAIQLARSPWGIALMVIALLIPFGVMFYPNARRIFVLESVSNDAGSQVNDIETTALKEDGRITPENDAKQSDQKDGKQPR